MNESLQDPCHYYLEEEGALLTKSRLTFVIFEVEVVKAERRASFDACWSVPSTVA